MFVILSNAKNLAKSLGENSSGKLKLIGCKQHSSGKLKFPSSQTNAHSALASQPTLYTASAQREILDFSPFG